MVVVQGRPVIPSADDGVYKPPPPQSGYNAYSPLEGMIGALYIYRTWALPIDRPRRLKTKLFDYVVLFWVRETIENISD